MKKKLDNNSLIRHELTKHPTTIGFIKLYLHKFNYQISKCVALLLLYTLKIGGSLTGVLFFWVLIFTIVLFFRDVSTGDFITKSGEYASTSTLGIKIPFIIGLLLQVALIYIGFILNKFSDILFKHFEQNDWRLD